MAKAPLEDVVHHIRKMVDAQILAEATDRQLVDRFARGHEESAFTILLRRHGPMVLGVSQGILRQLQDAEDVFQATFLLLARKASSIRKRESVASWLHGVAYRLAVRAKAQRALRRSQEMKASAMRKPGPNVEEAWRELRPVLNEEMEKLPESYRTALILCYLEGKTHEEVARQLGCPLGTVRSRVGRGRKLLQERLTRRGLSLSAGSFTAFLIAGTTSATLRAQLLDATLKASLQFATARSTAELISAPVAALVEGGLKAMLSTKLKIATALVLALSFMAGAGALAHQVFEANPLEINQDIGPQPAAKRPEAEAKEQARTDRYGDSLPPGAVARIGTVRWWHGHDRCPMVYAPDGRSLVSCDPDKGILILDTATGKELRRIEIQGESISCYALSPDGNTIITGSWPGPALRQWDVSTGKELRQIPTGDKLTSVLAFAPDGKTVAAVTGQTLIRLWDVATWQEIRQLVGETHWINALVFLPDGKTLVSGGGNTSTLRWWDVGTGREIRQKKADGFQELALSRDGKRLATLESRVLYLWNATTGEQVSRTVLSKDYGSWCMCFSPDGEILACSDMGGHSSRSPAPYQTIFFSATTGKELRRWDEERYITRLAFSPDGKVLAQAAAGVIRLRDVTTSKPILEVLGLPSYVMSVRFAADGKRLLASCQGGQTGSWDPLTGEQLSLLKGPPEGFAGHADTAMLLVTTLSADGRKAALVDRRGVLHVWDPATAKVWCRINEPPVATAQADFSPDGNILVVKHVDDVSRLWDALTGKLQSCLTRFDEGISGPPHAFSPDGRILATTLTAMKNRAVIRLWETATGKELGRLTWEDGSAPDSLMFAADGKHLVVAHCDHHYQMIEVKEKDIGLRLWDLATQRELQRFKAPVDVFSHTVVISPDGKTLAAGARDTVLLWELASGKERGRFPGHRERVMSLAFSPNGRLLASGSLDYTALVWDVTGLSGDGKLFTRAARSDEIERLWAELSSEDGIRAYRAMWMMVAAARPSVSFLAARLRPKEPVEDDRLKRLIADLDSDQYKVRTQASQELEELGELAETTLRKALAGTLSPEARQRLENLLHKVEVQILSPKQLLTLRALEVLEHCRTPEAKHVLQTLAAGTPEARLTQEAKASLERLAKRPTTATPN
jgi:RNA polymerase sigma factor (sigma-70 family)